MLALQREQRRSDPNSPLLPLIIMTSEDTDLPTRALIDRLGALGGPVGLGSTRTPKPKPNPNQKPTPTPNQVGWASTLHSCT